MAYHHFKETGAWPKPYLRVKCIHCGKVDKRTELPFDPKNPLPLASRIQRTVGQDEECPGSKENNGP